MAEKLLTTDEFNKLVRKWGDRVRLLAQSTLATGTHSTHSLQNYLTVFVDEDDKSKSAYKLKFHFERYGVYRAYGAGRGYVIANGNIVRGARIRTNREIKERKISEVANAYLAKGYSMREVNMLKTYKVGSEKTVTRTPLDWIDRHVDANLSQLADLVQEYYGDKALSQLLQDFNNIKIVK